MKTTFGLSYTLEGPAGAPVVVLSHSLGTDSRMWLPQLAPFSREFRVLSYDTRGHGGSDTPAGPYSLAELGGDVLRLLDELAINEAYFCGLSLGGLTGLWLGIHAPERFKGLVLANTAPSIATPEVWAQRIHQVETAGMHAIALASPARWFTPGFIEAEPETVAQVQAMVEALPPAGYAGCCEALRDANLWPELARIQAPTLLVTGVFDPVTTPEEAHRAAELIPGATVAELAASHMSNIEAASDFNRAVLAFLDGIERKAEFGSPRA